jgi:putative hemolysin
MTEMLQLLAIILAMAGSAFYSGIETGVISIHRMRLRHFVRRGEPGADILEGFLENSDRLLGTTLVGTNLCNVLVSVLAASFAVRLFGVYGESVAAVVIAIVLLIFAEYLPKAWFHARPLIRSLRFARLLQISEAFFRPLAAASVGFTRLIVRGSKASLSETVPFVTRDDLLTLAHEGEEHGVLSHDERVMIHRVFALSSKTASQIMIPGAQMTRVNANESVEGFYGVARASGFTRMPVYDADRDEYVGIVNVMYVLSEAAANRSQPIRWFARPPLFVRESTPVDDVLPLMRRFRQPMCLVQNDREAVTGLLTAEDILDEIVGPDGTASGGGPNS